MIIVRNIILLICVLVFGVAGSSEYTTVFQQMYYTFIQGFAAICFCIMLPRP